MSILEYTATFQVILSLLTLILLFSNNYSINRIEHSTNSMKDELVNEVRLASLAEGRLERKND